MTQNKTLTWTVSQDEAGAQLRRLLYNKYGFSRRQLIRLRKEGVAQVNGNPVSLTVILAQGDRVYVELPEHLALPEPENIPLTVLYEDAELTVIDKPAGLVVHPTRGYPNGTLLNGLAWRWREQGRPGPVRLVTRLDRETSGLVLVAANAWMHNALINTRIDKEYLAVTRGVPSPLERTIDVPLGRVPDFPGRGVTADGKPSRSHYRVESVAGELALVRLWPETGRTHQLRLHMAHIGCPIVDDYLYGQEEGLVGRVALHACHLTFKHPVSGRDLEFSSPLPKDMGKFFPGRENSAMRRINTL